jgi:hypothetical protein
MKGKELSPKKPLNKWAVCTGNNEDFYPLVGALSRYLTKFSHNYH